MAIGKSQSRRKVKEFSVVSKFFYFAFFVIFIISCSSSQKVETNIKSGEGNLKAIETNTVINKAIISAVNQSNVTAASPDGNVTIQNFAITKDNVRNTKDKKGAGSGNTPIAPNVTHAAVASPDNSEIISSMDAKGQPLETRTFKNHPILVKIERTNLDSRDIKVYLKNGKTVVLPESWADSFLTAPASDILKAVGLN